MREVAHLGGVGDVGRERQRPRAKRLSVLCSSLEQLAAPGGQDHVGAVLGESAGGRQPYAARGPGDHNCRAAQILHKDLALLRLSADALPTPWRDITREIAAFKTLPESATNAQPGQPPQD